MASQKTRRLSEAEIIKITKRESPLVVSIPHSCTWIPPEALGHVESSRIILIDTDILTDRLYAEVAKLGSSVVTRVSPYVVNINRGFTKPELPIIPRQLLSGQATLLRPYSQKACQHILDSYYRPYHAALQRLIDEACKRFGFALVFDGHSMDRQGMAHTKDPGERRADIVIGDNHGQAAHVSITHAIFTYLSSAGFQVALNKPYSGGHITKAYGLPAKRVHAIQIELVKSLYCRTIATEFDLAGGRTPKLTKGQPKLALTLRQALQAALRAAAVA